MNKITISAGNSKFGYGYDNIIKAYRHNHRMGANKNHRNVVSELTNYELKNGEITPIAEKPRQWIAKKREEYGELLEKQYQLQESTRLKEGKERPIRKSELKPVSELIVNFGGVYNFGKDSKATRIAKTEAFRNSKTPEEWQSIIAIAADNLKKWAKQHGAVILDFTFHMDEEGLPHGHAIITNFNNKTGEGLGIRTNKNKIGDDLQDTICQNLEPFGLHRALGKKNGKKQLTKEQLAEIGEKEEEIRAVNEKLEEITADRDEIQADIDELQEEHTALIRASKAQKEEIDELMEQFQGFIDDIIKLGEEKKGESMLKTALKYAEGGKNKKLEAIIAKAERTKEALIRDKNLNQKAPTPKPKGP